MLASLPFRRRLVRPPRPLDKARLLRPLQPLHNQSLINLHRRNRRRLNLRNLKSHLPSLRRPLKNLLHLPRSSRSRRMESKLNSPRRILALLSQMASHLSNHNNHSSNK